jgi:hypothetical protein
MLRGTEGRLGRTEGVYELFRWAAAPFYIHNIRCTFFFLFFSFKIYGIQTLQWTVVMLTRSPMILAGGEKSLYGSLFYQAYGTRSFRIPAEKPPLSCAF